MVYQYMPAYVDVFQSILEKMDCIKRGSQNTPAEEEQQHEDNRAITGKKTQAEIQDMYAKQMEVIDEDGEQDPLS